MGVHGSHESWLQLEAECRLSSRPTAPGGACRQHVMDTTNERHQRLLAVVAAGIAIRLATFYLFPEALAIAESRPELSTPVTSWKSRKSVSGYEQYRDIVTLSSF